MSTSSHEASDALYQEAIATFRVLLDEAIASGDREPTAMTLATVGADGRVSARIVLLKSVDADGFRFFTNYESRKGAQIAAHSGVALCFHWKLVGEQVQVRVEGDVSKASASESDAYFSTRPRGSQIGAWASLHSKALPDRGTFEQRIAETERRFEGTDVPRPPHWGGYVVKPDRIEFWYGAKHRLHERVAYVREGGSWSKGLLYP
jgi:pyridoxamine 5'-phosphate oxidase